MIKRNNSAGRTKIKHLSNQCYQIKCSGISLQQPHLAIQNTPYNQIISIDISKNVIREIPASIFIKLINLENVNASLNKIQKISLPYVKKSKLSILNVSDNKLDSLNLEHLNSLKQLYCSNNKINLLTLPSSLQIIQANNNKITNTYFLQNCNHIKQIKLAYNQLYELKFNDGKNMRQKTYKFISMIDCKGNKIEFLKHFNKIKSIKSLNLEDNLISFNSANINEILQLINLQNLNILDNPLADGGNQISQIQCILKMKLPNLKVINQTLEESSVQIGAYNLFMESEKKTFKNQWNFTLGDCQDEEQTFDKNISDIYQDNSLKNSTLNQQNSHQITFIKQHYHPNQFHSQPQNKQKCSKENNPRIQKLLMRELISMSYVPKTPLKHKDSKLFSYILQKQSDQYIVLQKMFKNRGGLTAAKKISQWKTTNSKAIMGFLLNKCSNDQFLTHFKSPFLIPKRKQDILSQNPNAFCCYHIIVRAQQNCPYYSCLYLIQTQKM